MAQAVVAHLVHVVPLLAPLSMAVTNPLKHSVLRPNPPLSAFARPRPLLLRTAKENKHAATGSP
jgi:hypothetical protein